MRSKNYISVLAVCVILMAAVIANSAAVYAAQEETHSADLQESEHAVSVSGTSGRVRSSGRVRYEYALIDGDDLRWVDAYISEKKDAAARTLNQLGTRFRQQSGQYAYDRNPDVLQEDIDLRGLDWTTLIQAAKESQSVPAGLSVLNPEAALHIEGVEERTDYYEAATEDNLSAGKAAWVDGRLLLGNGADNNRAYQQGLTDGGQRTVPDNLRPIYGVRESSVEIRHAHVGSPVESEGVSGCYYNHFVTTTKERVCDMALYYFDAIWYPDESAPEGGEWHGGFYTCSNHGGQYESPGICGQTYTKYYMEWEHNVTCGLENTVYARLTIKAADIEQEPDADDAQEKEQPVSQICLSAVLERGDGYNRLAWKKGGELVWTDSKGNVLGIGPELTVSAPGIYRCSLNVTNEDINRRTAEVEVRVSGLIMPGN